ncbi:hypothetical protein [Azotobacter beijerinckii]|uniref:Uncharacterized protein n=1 Tax=Azotobacter beijerinckii TaxID=170623 RepID=A0A1I1BC67_9GAMM|nr:hypothetical protein [Azotobacter beijerinckii]SFB46328.1 hypothetical protein SAMN04244571_02997 [Azotobacter beijerinckii]
MSEVKRYDPEEVLTDRWERAGMEELPDGNYVEYDDFEALQQELTAAMVYRDQGWALCAERDATVAGLRAQVEQLEKARASDATMIRDIVLVGESLGIPGEDQEGGVGEFLEAIENLRTEREKLAVRCRELEEENERVREHSEYVAEAANRIGAGLRAVREALRMPDDANLIDDLAPAIDALHAEVERLRRDAERLDKLQSMTWYSQSLEADAGVENLDILLIEAKGNVRAAIDKTLEGNREADPAV